MSFIQFSRTGAALAALCGTALLAGCGGGGSSNNIGSSPQIRAVNAISNGGSGTISVNNSVVSGSQGYFGASSYQSLGSPASLVTYSLSAASGITYPSVTANFSVGNFYSVILVGRADITTASDPRYPSVIITSDTFTTLSSGQAALRIVQAAPDAGAVDVLVNNVAAASGAAYKSVSGDIGEGSGNLTVQVNQAGTNTILVSPQTISVTGGHVYTVYVVEPTVTPTPLYGLQQTDDTSIVSPSG